MSYLKLHIIDFLYLMLYQLKLILPFWLGGIILGGIIAAYFSERLSSFLARINTSNHPQFSIIMGSLIGAVSPITMHGMIPVVMVMQKKGMPQYVLASFVISSVLINPNVFFYSFALGADIAFLRLLVTLLAGYAGGVIMKTFSKKTNAFNAYYDEESKEQTEIKRRVLALRTMLKTIKKTFPYLIAGIALTALFEKTVPKDIFADIFVNNAGLGVLFGSVLGVPLYFCGGGSIPLILSWMNNGMSTGSVMAFVIAGPATKINNITAIAAMAKKKYLFFYFLFITLFSIIAGLITDLIF